MDNKTTEIMDIMNTTNEVAIPDVVQETVKKSGGLKKAGMVGGVILGGALLTKFVILPVGKKIKKRFCKHKTPDYIEVEATGDEVEMEFEMEVEDPEEVYPV